ncbi:hypothetical protein BEN49_22715 [Hymenobacter coccineus]|uniref:Mannosyltransferase n=1 Tax=Hymenobacter coccineus TaxID=1908235 RepID=A0A1G1THU0_9BACT|nr:hypothetical protein BEN49_22715 [Hymenobacter coccineus]
MALLLTGAAYWGLAYATPRTHFGQLLGLFAVAGAAYAWLLHTRLPLRWGLGAALVFRLLWLPATPALSNDFYRFRWDGLLVSHGHNPFAKTPRQLLAATPTDSAALPLPELRHLLPLLNSPAYFSVYPPVCQALYGAAARAFPTSQTGFLMVVRGALLLADAGAAALLLWLLPLAGWPARRALAYLLHPLAVVEVMGNVHMEGAVVFFLLLTGALLARRRAGWPPGAGPGRGHQAAAAAGAAAAGPAAGAAALSLVFGGAGGQPRAAVSPLSFVGFTAAHRPQPGLVFPKF